MLRRPLAVLAAALALVVTTSAAAWADPAGPTNYRSRVTSVEPAIPGLEAEVFGGDAFLVLEVPPGSEVFVPGYQQGDAEPEPYLWFAPDGNVLVNERSPARYLNDARFGSRDVTVPAFAGADKPPVWTRVAVGGTYAWHDHRIHWMSPTPPPQVRVGAAGEQEVLTWEVPLVVNGESVVVRGELVWAESRPPAVPVVVALAALMIAALAARARRVLAPVAVIVAGAAALVVGFLQQVGLPAGAVGPTLPLLLPAVGVLGAGVGLAVFRRSEIQGVVLTALAAVPVAAAGLVQARALVAPEVPTTLAPAVVGALLAVAIGAAIGALLGGLSTLITPLEAEPVEAG